MKNYYLELPDTYKEAKVLDFNKNKKWVIYITYIQPILLILFSIILSLIKGVKVFGSLIDIEYLFYMIISLSLYLVFYIIYIVIHELIHGLAYKILTKQKLTFGFTKTVAFCGVPNIYTSRKTAIISTLSPFVVFGIVFILLVIFLPANMWGFISIIMLVSHFLGCSGDLYCAYLLIHKLPKGTLMLDTGPVQTFYVSE